MAHGATPEQAEAVFQILEIAECAYPDSKIIEALEITRNKSERLPSRAKMHGTPPT